MRKYVGVSTLEVLLHAKNYNKWIAQTFIPHLQSPILEIGAGIGNLSSFFVSKTPYYLTDVDKKLVEKSRKRFITNKGVHFKYFNVLHKPSQEFVNNFSSIIGINVLEHIEDDEKAIQNLNKVLKRKGKLLLLVPAMKFAYTRFDRQLGHFRRYKKKELAELLEENGFIVDDIYYFNIVGLVSWIIRDKVERSNVDLKPYQIKLFDSIVPFLRSLETKVRPPMGVSLIVIAHKK